MPSASSLSSARSQCPPRNSELLPGPSYHPQNQTSVWEGDSKEGTEGIHATRFRSHICGSLVTSILESSKATPAREKGILRPLLGPGRARSDDRFRIASPPELDGPRRAGAYQTARLKRTLDFTIRQDWEKVARLGDSRGRTCLFLRLFKQTRISGLHLFIFISSTQVCGCLRHCSADLQPSVEHQWSSSSAWCAHLWQIKDL